MSDKEKVEYKRSRAKIALGIVVIFILVFSFIYIVDDLSDNNYLGLNPPDKESVVPIIVNEDFGSLSIYHDITVVVYLHYVGVLVEGEEVTISGLGYLNTTRSQNNVYAVSVQMLHSFGYPIRNNSLRLPINNNLYLKHINGTNELRGSPVNIEWPVAGDYTLGLVVYFNNSSAMINFLNETTVHVESKATLNTERFNKVNQALTIALVLFAFVEGISFVVKGFAKSIQSKSITTASITANPSPTNSSDSKIVGAG